MTTTAHPQLPLNNADRFFIDGQWVKPSSDATIDVIDSGTEQLYFQVPEAQPADMDLAIGAARRAIGREGGREGLLPYLETKTLLLDGDPAN
jgi:acyl-CoA reductase-like NAD-dependent aldehyde dehydrogenase